MSKPKDKKNSPGALETSAELVVTLVVTATMAAELETSAVALFELYTTAAAMGTLVGAKPPRAYLVQDTFTDADGTLISAHTPERAPAGSAWATIAGPEWQIQGNRVRGSGHNEARTIINSGETNVDVQADIVLDGTNESSGIVYRAADVDNVILPQLVDSTNEIHIYKEVTNTFTSIASKAYTLAAGTYTVRGTVDSAHEHNMYVAGALELTVTDSALSTNTSVGCHEGNLSFPEWDNFTCYLFGDRP